MTSRWHLTEDGGKARLSPPAAGSSYPALTGSGVLPPGSSGPSQAPRKPGLPHEGVGGPSPEPAFRPTFDDSVDRSGRAVIVARSK